MNMFQLLAGLKGSLTLTSFKGRSTFKEKMKNVATHGLKIFKTHSPLGFIF
jgi:hypothetical protein